MRGTGPASEESTDAPWVRGISAPSTTTPPRTSSAGWTRLRRRGRRRCCGRPGARCGGAGGHLVEAARYCEACPKGPRYRTGRACCVMAGSPDIDCDSASAAWLRAHRPGATRRRTPSLLSSPPPARGGVAEPTGCRVPIRRARGRRRFPGHAAGVHITGWQIALRALLGPYQAMMRVSIDGAAPSRSRCRCTRTGRVRATTSLWTPSKGSAEACRHTSVVALTVVSGHGPTEVVVSRE